MLEPMALLLDSFWRAMAYCVHPRVIMLSLLPLLLMAISALVLGYFYWDAAVQYAQALLQAPGLMSSFWNWLQRFGIADATSFVAPLMVVAFITPLIVLVALLVVAVLMTPALVALVAQRRFATLERKKGGSLLWSLGWSLGSTALALLALVVSVPLWLIPPLVLVLPPLIWGWLTYRVMAFDALAEHASSAERKALFLRHRWSLLLIGIFCGYLGAAPAIVWASGVVFAAAFFILIPLAIWIYTLVFAFSSLWFAHFCLSALALLRAETDTRVVIDPSERMPDSVLTDHNTPSVTNLPPSEKVAP
ncbi:EI24 domain-containing protein [Simplicispira sp.]|uniref:EI24 domain-containing protein n=1 Tax=Simplicispira sp. TaxID=2015802 RepID=UPI00258D42FC|nr:EI24 domain-containing protein [Simplicispira sp.]